MWKSGDRGSSQYRKDRGQYIADLALVMKAVKGLFFSNLQS